MLKKLKGKIFDETSDKWVEFVYNNRVGLYLLTSKSHNHDEKFHYVYGYVADTKLFPTIRKYKIGKISFEDLKKRYTTF